MSSNDVPEKFEKRASSFYISVRRTHIDIELFGESVTTKVVIIGEAKIYGDCHEWVDMGGWYLDDTHGVLEFVNGDVSIKLCLSSEEIEKIFNIILSDRSL